MKTMKKVLCVLLVVLMCLTSAPLGGFVGLELPEWNLRASAANELAPTGQCGDNVYWTFDSETGELVISGTGPMAEFNANLSPFRGVKSVIIENGVTTISDYIFVECNSLTSVTIGNSVTTIGVMAFGKCTKLTSVTIPNSVTTIGNDAFVYCTNLTDIRIPYSVTTIGEDAFYGCDSITSVTIPDSVITIGIGAFADCDNLQCISVDKNSATYYSDDQGILFNKDKTILVQYPKGNKNTSYTIPDTVTTIGAGAFFSCDSFTNITIPDSVITIGDYAFESCNSLTSVKIPDDVTTIGMLAFAGCVSLTSVKIPDGVTTIGGMAFMSCTSLTNVTISDNTTTIPEGAFAYCTNLTSITIPDGVITIGDSAFYSCASLTDVYFIGTEEKWNAIEIGDYNDNLLNANIHFAPHSHQYLESITKKPTCIAKGEKKFTCDCGDSYVEEIPAKGHDFKVVDSGKVPTCEEDGYTAKRKCSVCGKEDGGEVIPSDGHDFKIIDSGKAPTCEEDGYTAKRKCSVCGKEDGGEVIPANGHIDNNGDGKCDSCGKDMSNDERTVIATGQCGDKAFYTLYSDGELVITGEGAMWDYDDFENKSPFSNNADIRKVTIETEITSIGAFAFCDCVNLVIVTTGNKITTIGSSAFFCCHSLQKINIPEGVTIIEDEAFYDCIALTNVTIPNSVTTIGDNAFDSCSSITDITIGKGVTYIGNEAFRGCEKIESVFIPQNVANIGCGAFSFCNNLSAFVVEDGNKNFSHDSYGVLFNKEKTVLVQYPIGNLNKKYSIPDSVETVDVVAFKWSDNLSDIIIGTNVTFIGDDAFSKCTGLTDITIPGNVISIGMGAFSDCSNLVNVVCENGVKNIGLGAFNSCISLESITFGDSITSIEECAFYYCYNITDVYYYGVESQWNNIDIEDDNDNLLNATIHFLGEEEEECTHKETFEQTIPASCTVSGMKFTVCVDCGETIGNPEVIPAAHTPGEWEIVVEPTYEAEGKKVKKCTVCGETLEEEIIPKLELAVVEDEETGVGLEFPAENYDGKVEIEVKESFDGTAFNILDTKTGAEHKKIYDIKMLVDGEVTQPNGKVKVKLPLPAGYNPKFSFVYYVNTETGAVEKMEATYEDGYMVFETDHFSYYAIIAEPDTDNCSCNCHAGGIKKFFFKFLLFFQKIFRTNKECKCGIKHY